MQKIILASQSPRRKQLLEWAKVPFDIIVKPTDETFPDELSLEDIPIHIAKAKAKAVREVVDNVSQTILAADTIVLANNKVIGKPVDRHDAIGILSKLSGSTHKVITGVVIAHAEGEICFSDVTHVQFHPLSLQQIEYYVDNYKPYDKAGAYAIQEWIGVVGIKSIKGDFYNVMGLPVSKVVQALEKLA